MAARRRERGQRGAAEACGGARLVSTSIMAMLPTTRRRPGAAEAVGEQALGRGWGGPMRPSVGVSMSVPAASIECDAARRRRRAGKWLSSATGSRDEIPIRASSSNVLHGGQA
jgi:hypothetical protein